MSESNPPRPVAGPLLDLDEWESAWAPGDPAGSSAFRDYRGEPAPASASSTGSTTATRRSTSSWRRSGEYLP